MVTARVMAALFLAGIVVHPAKAGHHPSSAAQQVFRSGVDLTSFGVTVTDRKGALVTNLTQDDFELIEDGTPQTLKYFALGEGETSPEMHVGLMIDSSGTSRVSAAAS